MAPYFKKLIAPLIALTLGLSVFVWKTPSTAVQPRPKGWLKGKVIAPLEVGVAGVSLTIKGDNVQYDCRSEKGGFYQIELPPGKYQIMASLPDFLPFRRSSFIVHGDEDLFLNVYLIPDPDVNEHKPKPLLYAEFQLPSPSLEPSDILVSHIEGAKNAAGVQFEKATLTYDALTVMADRITFDKASFRFLATGNVILDERGKRSRVRQVELSFTAQGSSLQVTKGVIRSINGKGTLGDTKNFEFRADRNLKGYLSFEDKKNYVYFVSTQIMAVDVIDEVTNKVRILGAGFLNGALAVNFTLIVHKGPAGSEDTVSIDFHLNNLSYSGSLSTGKIEFHREDGQ